MLLPPPAELLARLRALPAAALLLERLGSDTAVYLVGGAVRDLLMGTEPTELDLVVEGDTAAVATTLGGTAVIHERFGTSTVYLDGFRFDLARTRRETYPAPGALPEVAPASLRDDLLRRDFTVNAMAMSLSGRDAGALQAVARALEDLEARLLRVLHDRSFSDDPTRLLRLARYRARLEFGIESQTRELARAAVAANALDTVSGTRVGAELRQLARERDPVATLESLAELGLDAAIHGGFGLSDPSLARRALGLLPADGRSDVLVLALAGAGIPAPELRELLDRLAFPADERDAILGAAVGAEPLARRLEQAQTPSEIAAGVDQAPPEIVALAGALGPEAAAAEWLDHARHVRLEIDGRELIAAGVAQGPAVGRGLQAALHAKLDGRVAGRQAELEAALAAAREVPPGDG